jgi:hypothetical protein
VFLRWNRNYRAQRNHFTDEETAVLPHKRSQYGLSFFFFCAALGFELRAYTFIHSINLFFFVMGFLR